MILTYLTEQNAITKPKFSLQRIEFSITLAFRNGT
jgi:hypothetical protein